jgi:sugar lactone lactonase YvrE
VTVLPVPGTGPEDVLVDSEDRLVTGLADGSILRLSQDGQHLQRLANTNGRPLGIEQYPDGSLIICDAIRGLLRCDQVTGEIAVVVDSVNGERLRFTNNAAVSRNGAIYFTDSSRRFGLDEFKGDLLAHTSSGRLLRWNPDGSVEVLVEGLAFANGVALAADESFVLVAETGGYRVTRYELTGPESGNQRVVCENLPGLPDNLSTGTDGIFWMAMPSERNKILDTLLPKPGALRSALWALPDRFQPEATRVTWVIGIDGDGNVRRNLHAPGKTYHYVTGVREHNELLYLGSLAESGIGVIPL